MHSLNKPVVRYEYNCNANPKDPRGNVFEKVTLSCEPDVNRQQNVHGDRPKEAGMLCTGSVDKYRVPDYFGPFVSQIPIFYILHVDKYQYEVFLVSQIPIFYTFGAQNIFYCFIKS